MHIKKLNLNNAPFIWALQKQDVQKPSISFSQMLKGKRKKKSVLELNNLFGTMG